ncbi:MAG: methyltransferase [Moorellales bacterium]
MLVIGVGLAGLGLLGLYDLASLRALRGRGALAVAGYAVHALALVLATVAFPAAPSSREWVGLGAVLAAVGGIWLVYVVILYRPVRRTYRGNEAPLLSDEGPYALCRHPGLWGYLLLLAGLNLVRPSLPMVLAGLVWTLADLAYIVLQDRYFFPRLFADYPTYSGYTPMLLPNRRSWRRFRATLQIFS